MRAYEQPCEHLCRPALMVQLCKCSCVLIHAKCVSVQTPVLGCTHPTKHAERDLKPAQRIWRPRDACCCGHSMLLFDSCMCCLQMRSRPSVSRLRHAA